MNPRLALAVLLPFIACGLQWLLWSALIEPYVWFLFFPAAFFSASLGGLKGGVAGTIIGALLAWYVFIPPQLSFAVRSTSGYASIILFLATGTLFAWFHERLHRALQAAEGRFEATFEQAAVGVAMLAPDGRWLRANRKLCAILGYSADELAATTIQTVTHPDDRISNRDFARRMLANEIDSGSVELRLLHKDGSAVWVNLTVALVAASNDDPACLVAIAEDVTRRKATEIALLKSHTRLHEAQRLAGIGQWRWDVRGGRHFWSEELYRIYGLSPTQPPVAFPEARHYFAPASWAVLSAAVASALASGKAYECDAEVVRPDGTRVWVSARGEALRDPGGSVTELQSTVQDITLRKVTELELRRRNAELEHFDRAAIGRELRMIELKREVNALSEESGRAPPYDLAFADVQPQDPAR